MKILFITHNRLGDAVLSSCLLNHVIIQHPNAEITVAAGEIPAPLFRTIPQVKRMIIIKKLSYERHWLLLWLKTVIHCWDMVIDCRGSAISYLLWSKKRYCHYDKTTKKAHRIQRYASLMRLQNLPTPKLWPSSSAIKRANTLTKKHQQIIAIAPAANWRAKTWRATHFTTLIQRLTAEESEYHNASIMIITAPHERDAIQTLLNTIPIERYIDLAGTEDLDTIAACLTHCAFFVGNDSGLMHMAAAAGIPTLGLFGPSNPALYAPFGEKADYVTTPKTPEALMGPSFNHLTADTLMDSLSVDQVIASITKLMHHCSQ